MCVYSGYFRVHESTRSNAFSQLGQTSESAGPFHPFKRYSVYSFSTTLDVFLGVQVNSALECSFLLLKGPYDDVRIKPVIHHHSFSNDTNETDYVPLPISDSVECNKLLAAKNINLRLFIFQVQK